jgi:hypothetical protein
MLIGKALIAYNILLLFAILAQNKATKVVK